MSEDSQSTESLPPSAEHSDSGPITTNNTTTTAATTNTNTTTTTTTNDNNNNNDSSTGSAAPSKSRHAAPSAKSEPTDKLKPEEAKPVNGAHSQPMTVSNSTSSEVTSVTDGAAAPYSTRSRGRNGAPRPNYAEDIEMDFELTSPAPSAVKAVSNSAKQSANGSPARAPDSEKGPAASTRKNQATANSAQPNAAAKEAIPGTSTFSASVTSNNGSSASAASRKRKQPPNGTNSNGSAKKQQLAAPGPKRDIRLSNMMTFENCGARLKNGKLKADDGTVLEVNGKILFVIFL